MKKINMRYKVTSYNDPKSNYFDITKCKIQLTQSGGTIEKDERSNIEKTWDKLRFMYDTSSFVNSPVGKVLINFTPLGVLDNLVKNDTTAAALSVIPESVFNKLPKASKVLSVADDVAPKAMKDTIQEGIDFIKNHYDDVLSKNIIKIQEKLRNPNYKFTTGERLNLTKNIESIKTNPNLKYGHDYRYFKSGRTATLEVDPNATNPKHIGKKLSAEIELAKTIGSSNPKAYVSMPPRIQSLLRSHYTKSGTTKDSTFNAISKLMTWKADLGIKNSMDQLTPEEGKKLFDYVWSKKFFDKNVTEFNKHIFWNEHKDDIMYLFKLAPTIAGASVIATNNKKESE